MYEEQEHPLVLCRKRVGESAEWLVGTGYADAMCSCVVSCKQDPKEEKRVFAAPGLAADAYAGVTARNDMLDAALLDFTDDDPNSLYNRIQREGREAFERGEVVVFDPDTSQKAENRTPVGRVVIEFYTAEGLTPGKLYVRQNEKWAKIFGHIVAVSDRARALEPELEVGMKIVFERCAADQTIDFCVPSGGTQILASFPLLHIGDIVGYYPRVV